MKLSRYQIRLNSKWTKRLAMTLSILYLANPLYVPLSYFFHETIAFFESANTAIGHQDNSNNYVGFSTNHEHETMELQLGHELVNLVGSVIENSKEKNSTDVQLPEIVKCDKHISTTIVLKGFLNNSLQTAKYWSIIEKSQMGFPIETKKPPRFS